MKLYTRGGDGGETALFSGQRVSKDHVRVNAYGAVDEACSVLGWALAAPDVSEPIRALGRSIQSDLFDLGAELATPPAAEEKLQRRLSSAISGARIEALEKAIDAASDAAPELKTFVLPGGAEGAARLHIARTVARRAEREVVGLAAQAPVRDEVLTYLNRLSDLLFALARQVNHETGHGDVEWSAKK